MRCLVDGSIWRIMSLAKNRDRVADYVDELADKAQQKWRMAWVSETNGQYQKDTSWTEEIIQLLPFFHAYSLRRCNPTEKQRQVIQMNKSCQKMIQLPFLFFFPFLFFPFLTEVPRTQPLGSPHDPVYCPGQALCQKGKSYLFFHLVIENLGGEAVGKQSTVQRPPSYSQVSFLLGC